MKAVMTTKGEGSHVVVVDLEGSMYGRVGELRVQSNDVGDVVFTLFSNETTKNIKDLETETAVFQNLNHKGQTVNTRKGEGLGG